MQPQYEGQPLTAKEHGNVVQTARPGDATRLLRRKIAGDYCGKDGRNEPERHFSGATKPILIGRGGKPQVPR
jgi:hypothetical protein